MKTKIPCGGFYLDDSLVLNEDNSLAVAGTHNALTVKFTPNTYPNANSDEYLCDTPFKQIAEALFVRGIPVNGLVHVNNDAVSLVSLSTCDFEKGDFVFSTPADIHRESVSGGSHIINEISFTFLTRTSRSIGSNDIYRMSEAVINVGNGPVS